MADQSTEELQAEILRRRILAKRQTQMTPMQKAMGIFRTGIQEGVSAVAGLPNVVGQMLERPLDPNMVPRGDAREAVYGTQEYRSNLGRAIQRHTYSPEEISRGISSLHPGLQPVEPTDAFGRVLKATGTGAAAGVVGGPVGFAGGAAGGAIQQGAVEAGLPPWAQMLVGIGVPIVGGMTIMGLKQILANTPTKMIKDALANATPQQMQAAQAFMDEAAKIGIRVTPDEAYTLVTGGANNGLLQLRRYVEQSRGGGPLMSAAMAERPGQNAAALRDLTGQLGPAAQAERAGQVPFTVQDVANRAMDDIRRARAQATEPFYAAVINAQNDLSLPRFGQIQSDKLLASKIKEIRQDPAWQNDIAGVTDNNTIVLDAVKKKLDDEIEALSADPGNRNRIRQLRASRNTLVEAMDDEFPDYAAARQRHAQITKSTVEPAEQSPLGALAKEPSPNAKSEQLMAEQINILQPMDPKTTTPEMITNTARMLNARDPTALAVWQRTNLEAAFARATREMQAAGAGEWGGAKFALAIAGNERQRANLKALIETLPNGKQTWKGFETYLTVLRAQGFRPHPGSMTEYNRLFSSDVEQGKIPIGLVRPVKDIQDWWLNWRRHKNTKVLAQVFLDPRGAEVMAKMANIKPNTQLARLYVGVLSAEMVRIISEQEPQPAPATTIRSGLQQLSPPVLPPSQTGERQFGPGEMGIRG